jgi:hypothetical protein
VSASPAKLAYLDVAEFDSIIILESLPLTHRKPGRRLHENVLIPIAKADPSPSISYNSVGTRAQFFGGLQAIEDQYVDKDRTPIVHI